MPRALNVFFLSREPSMSSNNEVLIYYYSIYIDDRINRYCCKRRMFYPINRIYSRVPEIDTTD